MNDRDWAHEGGTRFNIMFAFGDFEDLLIYIDRLLTAQPVAGYHHFKLSLHNSIILGISTDGNL
jgi:hypothetical protein